MPIICGTDFSESAAAAVDAAAALCARLGERELYVVHVLEQPLGLLPPAQLDAVKGATLERLEAEAQRLRARTSAEIQGHVLTGVASEALGRFAADHDARLLVVASQGYSASPVYRVGGTSERIALSARVPVLVVRDAAPFWAWAEGKRPLRALVGVDATASSDAAIRWISELRQAGACDVIAANVHDPIEESRRYGLRRRGLLEPDPELERLVVRDLGAHVGEVPGAGELSYRTVTGLGRVGDHLLELAETEGADLIVVGTHQKQGLGRLSSVSSVALHFGHAAVACVPMPKDAALPPRALPSIKRILVATDFSDVAARAVGYAYAMLAGRGGEVHLLHVVSPQKHPRAPHEDTALITKLRALVPESAASDDIVTRTEVAHADDVARAICEHAERAGADLVCVASHVKAGLRRAVFGSVTDAVMQLSARPVFVVRPLAP